MHAEPKSKLEKVATESVLEKKVFLKFSRENTCEH